MDSPNQPAPGARASWAKRLGVIGAAAATTLLAGCTTEQWEVGFLHPDSKGATSHTDHYIALWNGGWIAALIVGAITWGLLLWCIVAYRRKKSDRGLPVQMRYNMPVEILYTVVPIILVLAFFFENVKTLDNTINDDTEPEQVIEVYGKQWAWDFNYVTEDVHYAGVQANLDGTEQPGIDAPTLYLPSNTDLELKLESRDVVHSFWIPAFLEKRDMFPGHSSSIHLQALKEGDYMGKCAELCGEFHAEMIFNVKVVSPTEYDDYIQSLRDQGNEGVLGEEYNRTEWYHNPYEQEGAEN
ncbi:MAG: aa3-type cytochrome oxidase subunit II [Brevibacterium yomogidense]|uniref:aa3-type cytochrome oxidase subunit II n=1 Tax=Brevibacterium TaxID=1696 RepID=UPI000B360711|nr:MULTISPECIES: cytochrome c oxidase subunit II [Brevibacterium]SMX69292.1 cytochrome c oxidase subunit 2 [Brevibacterium sp. Mu109]